MNILRKVYTSLPKSLTRTAGKVSFWAQKNAPELLLAGGLITMVAGTVAACNQTTLAEQALDEHRERMFKVRKCYEDPDITYGDNEKKKDTIQLAVNTTGRLLRIYALPAGLEVAGIAMVLWSHGMMRKRQAALASAYLAVQTAFNQYRARVVQELGIDADEKFRTGIKTITTTVTEVGPDGKETRKEISQTVYDKDAAGGAVYARYFDETSKQWKKDMDLNLQFIRGQERWANSLLQLRGWLLLNDVYEMLDIPKTPEGAVVGWWNDKSTGDGYVSFGLDMKNGGVRALRFGDYTRQAILLNFNVDGPIYERLRDVDPERQALLTPTTAASMGVQDVGRWLPSGIRPDM